MKYDHLVPQNFSLELQFSKRVLHLNSLHYGIWEKNQPLDFENLEVAQKKYTQKILSMVPKGVKKVLDVGAGLGDNAIALSKAGYSVTSISPEIGQRDNFMEITKKYENIKFVHTKFEDFKPEEKYDLILMSESHNYFPTDEGLEKVKNCLNKGGYLLVTGMFRKNGSLVFEEVFGYEEYLSEAKRRGLIVIKDEDVTKDVLPTLEIGQKYLDYYINPGIEVLTDFYKYKYSLKTKLIALFFSKEINLMKDTLQELLPRRFDVKRFKENVYYRFILFKMNKQN